MSRRVVLDTSALVSAALRPGSLPHQALLEAFRGWTICACAETLDELERVLDRSKFDRYLPRRLRREFVTLIRRSVQLVEVQDVHLCEAVPHCRDPLDDKFLALALGAEAEVLISSDKDLRILHPWNGIAILSPARFLERFHSREPG
ncbi:MAG: putative toxin-antitoxin system toxin component, PIN family [Acidobacteriaceae bacterium]